MAGHFICQIGVGGLSQTIYYFAFGSNLNHYRLHQRVGDYEHIGVGFLPDHQLVFNKCGGDGSGKCTVIENIGHKVWGAICQLDLKQKDKLDYYEGVGHGYDAVFKNIVMQDQNMDALLYQAQLDAMDDGLAPFHWYKEFVLSGAKYHQLPNHYIGYLQQFESVQDPNQQRNQVNEDILNGHY